MTLELRTKLGNIEIGIANKGFVDIQNGLNEKRDIDEKSMEGALMAEIHSKKGGETRENSSSTKLYVSNGKVEKSNQQDLICSTAWAVAGNCSSAAQEFVICYRYMLFCDLGMVHLAIGILSERGNGASAAQV